jgi:hypothetical protein
VFGLSTEFQVECGRTTIRPLTKEFFDTWEQALQVHPNISREGSQAFIQRLQQQLQGYAACTIRLEAEPQRAREIAMEEAENGLALLRVFHPSILHPNVPSFCRPWGRQGTERAFGN